MRSPSLLGLKESSFGSDMPSITQPKTPFPKEESDSSSEPDMESNTDKSVNISLDKDSGIDSDNDFIAPDSELMLKIVTQVESYFSDENLMKDEFVLKHIRRNKDGFISLKLLASFRKVKALTKSWKVVAHCVKLGSNKLELNENESKIRRKTPLPAVDGDKYSRTIIAYNFEVGSDDINNISKVFAKFGDIALIRILKSGSSSIIPQHLLDRIKEKKDANKPTVATIEYNNKTDAEKALKSMERSARTEWRSPAIQVMPMKTTNKVNKISFKMNESPKRFDSRERSFSKNSYKQNNEIDVSLDIHNIPNKQRLFSRQKSKSYSSGDESRVFNRFSEISINKSEKFWTKPQLINNSIKSVEVIRNPRGPDGTTGFINYRNHRSPTI